MVIDTSALIAILRREPEADNFLKRIADTEGSLLSSVSFLEASMVLAGRSGDATAWIELDALIARAEIRIVEQDAELAEVARSAFLRYGRGRPPAALNLGDCAAYALAKHRNLPLLFKGDDFSRTDLPGAA